MKYNSKIIPWFIILLMAVPHIGICEAWFEADTIPPVFTNPPVNLSISCSEDYQMAISDWYTNQGGATATDNNGALEIFSTLSLAAINDSLENNIGALCNPSNIFQAGFYALDTCGNSSIDTLLVQIEIIDTERPILNSIAENLDVSCTENVQEVLDDWIFNLGGATATDACSQEVEWFQFLWNDSRGNSSIGHPQNGPFIPVISSACNWSVTVSFFVRDLCGNNQVTTATFSTVDTIAPVIETTAATVSFTCDAVGELNLDVTDNCDTAPNISFEDLSNNQSLDPTDCNFYNYELERLWTVSDACGNSTTFMQTIEVVDTITPTFEIPIDITIYCASEVDTSVTGSPSNISDNCNSNLEVTFTDSGEDSGCEFVINRFWQISDGCGSSNILPQLITVVDTIAPTITVAASDLSLDCNGTNGISEQFEDWINNLGGAAAEDECNTMDFFAAQPGSYDIADMQSFPGTPIDDFVDFICSSNVTDSVSVDFVFYDICGNASVSNASIVFSDVQAPTFSLPLEDLTIEASGGCEHQLSLFFPLVEDDCSVDSLLQKLIVIDDSTTIMNVDRFDQTFFIGNHELLYIAIDCAGNADSLSQTIVIEDNEAPTVICAEDITISADSLGCGARMELLSNIQYSDNCEIEFIAFELTGASALPRDTVSLVDTMPIIEIMPGQSMINYTLVDFSGNMVSCSYGISVEDKVRPILECKSDTLVIGIEELLAIQINTADLVASATDNCSIDSIFYRPDMLDCSSIAEVNEITIRAVDEAGNLTSCTSNLYIFLDTLQLSFRSGFCSGDSLQLFSGISDSTSLFVDWIGPNGYRSIDVNPIIENPSEDDSGVYQVTVSNAEGCFVSGQIMVTVEAVASPDIQASTLTLCDGDELVLTSTGYSGEISYEWYSGVPLDAVLLGNTTEPEIVINPQNGSQQYFVIIKNDDCDDLRSNPIVVDVISKPIVEVSQTEINICAGESFNLIALNPNPDATYTWTGPDNYLSNAPSPPEISNASELKGGVYLLHSSIGSCMSDTAMVVVNISPDLVTPTISGTRNICLGDTIKIFADGFFNEVDSFIWSTPKGIVSTLESPLFVLNADEFDVGNYSVTLGGSECRSLPSENLNVNLAMASLTPTILTQGPFCAGQTVQLEAAFISDARYEWQGPNNFTADNSSPLIFNINEDFIGDYQVRVRIGGCISQWSPVFNLELIDRPSIPTIATESLTLCRAMPNMSVSLCIDEVSTATGASYLWLVDNGQDTLGQTSGLCLELNSLENLENGENNISVFTALGSCISEPSSEIIINITNDNAVITADAGDDLIACQPVANLSALASDLAPGIWASLGNASIADPQSNNTEVSSLEVGENLFVWTLAAGDCNPTAADTMSVFLETIPELNDDEFELSGASPFEINVIENDELPQAYSLQILSSDDGLSIDTDNPESFQIEVENTLSGDVEFQYEVCNEICDDECEVATVTLKLGEQKLCNANNVITPNGDGLNDSFIIPCLEFNAFPSNSLTIFNQWGDEIFAASPYENNWQGTYAGDDLPVGTYFYILSLGDNNKFEDGFIQLER